MIQRCCNPHHPSYKDYGGRGINVCNRWRGKRGFENFLADAGPRPSAKHSIDRYPDNDGDYKPSNIRWATTAQQSRNHRANRFVSYRGRTMTVADFAREIGWSPAMVRHHRNAGRTPEWIAKRAKSRC